MLVTVAQERHRLFLVVALPMLVVVVAGQIIRLRVNQRQRGLGVLAVAVPVGSILFPHLLRRELLELLILVAVAVALLMDLLAVTAALASSSSSTTSALPQSSPSSHRRSGLHQRVR
jgi:hypothetical protein